MFNMLTGYEPFKGNTPSELKDSVLYATIKFEKIEDVDLRELCEKLLNRFVSKRITCKEAFHVAGGAAHNCQHDLFRDVDAAVIFLIADITVITHGAFLQM